MHGVPWRSVDAQGFDAKEFVDEIEHLFGLGFKCAAWSRAREGHVSFNFRGTRLTESAYDVALSVRRTSVMNSDSPSACRGTCLSEMSAIDRCEAAYETTRSAVIGLQCEDIVNSQPTLVTRCHRSVLRERHSITLRRCQAGVRRGLTDIWMVCSKGADHERPSGTGHCTDRETR